MTRRAKALFRNPPTGAANAGAEMYRHRLAEFQLLIPRSLQRHGETSLAIGPHVLRLHHPTRTIHGFVPDLWLVDLNADSAVTHEILDGIA